MLSKRPKVSIIIPTFNRAHLVEKAILSALKQTIKDIEIIVVDDGSTDNTSEVLTKYKNKIREVRHAKNRGVCAAKNTGLDHVRGEWFTILDSDDEMFEDALEVFLNVPIKIDSRVNAITCNCIDSSTGEFSGVGLDSDQFLSQETILKKTSGEFWGLTKTELIGDKRFNEDLPGWEFTLWYQVDAIARRYYIHTALRIYNTNEGHSVTKENREKNAHKKAQIYRILTSESGYWQTLKKYNRSTLRDHCLKGIFFLRIEGDRQGVDFYRKMLNFNRPGLLLLVLTSIIFFTRPAVLSLMYQYLPLNKIKL